MKRIMIIGATSGIGRATALLFIEKGWTVGVAGRRKEKLEELRDLAPERVFAETIDITQPDAPDRFHALIQLMHGMDVFLLCSGVGSQNAALLPSIELATIRTNVEGFARMLCTAWDYFRAQGEGHIAVVSSIAGTKGLGVAPSYSATKCFQNCYLDALAQLAHMQHLSIYFTDIRPGFVDTELLRGGIYPMLMRPERVARGIFHAILHKRRRLVIDARYRLLVFCWRLIPSWLWEWLPIHN
ncbi:oxidoreductase [Parabacteroides sp. An277]|uniref:SDR family NAD(P)-dependent oxidoreductase n=1 Tax=Parabacteroides sp. An277 TaxID=1965619 RepID=UPI000B381807|nr:SDR family NAD(P)-dependent oxidoreductase [Parabacteroides sp. An277]OUO53173.1 oxidoreductase [Parabacteroides sp. An277]